MARLTCRMRTAESGRGKRSPTRDFLSVVMKWPFSQDGPGSPVSTGSNRKVVGPSAPWLPEGTIGTESTRSLVLRESSDTTKTQWRTGGFPSIAVQISPRRGDTLWLGKGHLLSFGASRVFAIGLSPGPRRGDTLWLVKVHLLSCGAQGVFEIGLFRGSLGGQPLEISGRLTLQSSPVVQPTSHFHCLVHCLSDAFGSARLYHIVQVSIIARADRGR